MTRYTNLRIIIIIINNVLYCTGKQSRPTFDKCTVRTAHLAYNIGTNLTFSSQLPFGRNQ